MFKKGRSAFVSWKLKIICPYLHTLVLAVVFIVVEMGHFHVCLFNEHLNKSKLAEI